MKTTMKHILIAPALAVFLACSGGGGAADTTDSTQGDLVNDAINDSSDTATDAPAPDSSLLLDTNQVDVPSIPDIPDVPPEPTGGISGKLVNAQGEPLAGFGIISCTLSLCYNGETDENGEYLFIDVELGPRKMATHDPNNVYADMLFYQVVFEDVTTDLEEDVIIPAVQDAPQAWSEEDGGVVSLAQGQFELEAAAGTLDYPFGIFDHEVVGVSIPGSQIPPFDTRPWQDKEDHSLLLMVNPGHIEADPGVELRVFTGITKPAGTVYRIYTIEPDESVLIDAGTGTVGEDGILRSDPEAQLTKLSGFLLVPEMEPTP
jgi:hypothetical protein